MLKRKRLQTCLCLAAGGLLGYLSVSGILPLGRQAKAAPGNALPGILATQASGLIAAQGGEEKEAIVFTIRLPANAVLQIDEDKTRETGEVRTFQTPPLPKGRHYVYTLKASCDGKEVTRQIRIASGMDNTFDLRPDFRPTGKNATESKGSENEIKQIAEEAFIYGFPMVMNYGVIYESFIDKDSSQYKCPFNQLYNTARVFTPKDTAVVTPNSDTPYSFFCADLRAEPVVFTVPEIEKGRYYSVQLVDFYTFNYGYVGSRTTGNGGGHYMIAGPSWKGEKPPGVDKVFPCETDFTFAIFRTQLFNPADIENVKKVQAGYRLQTLSAYLNEPAPPAPAEIKWPKIDKRLAEADPFAYLNFLLQLSPAVGAAEVERPLLAKFAKIGIAAGKPFPPGDLTPEQKGELEAGIKSGYEKIKQQVATVGEDENGWRVATKGFGNRATYNGNWTLRAAAAMAGIYGNDAVEALYPLLATDSEGNKPDCSKNRYTLTFPAGKLPPVNAFWSVTMYDAKTQLLVENPIHRYLINSPMLPDLKKNDDGSLTIYIQKDSPGEDKQSNWLPAPDGPIYVVMRLYWPKKDALDGEWKPPAVMPAK